MQLVLLSAAGLSWGCASAGPPQERRFASNRNVADAFACSTRRLEAERFALVDADSTAATAVAFRHSPATPDVGRDTWWRIELSVARDPEGRTLVAALLGTADARDGPYTAPDVALLRVVGDLSAACTW
jgi:hypothetical protein